MQVQLAGPFDGEGASYDAPFCLWHNQSMLKSADIDRKWALPVRILYSTSDEGRDEEDELDRKSVRLVASLGTGKGRA